MNLFLAPAGQAAELPISGSHRLLPLPQLSLHHLDNKLVSLLQWTLYRIFKIFTNIQNIQNIRWTPYRIFKISTHLLSLQLLQRGLLLPKEGQELSQLPGCGYWKRWNTSNFERIFLLTSSNYQNICLSKLFSCSSAAFRLFPRARQLTVRPLYLRGKMHIYLFVAQKRQGAELFLLPKKARHKTFFIAKKGKAQNFFYCQKMQGTELFLLPKKARQRTCFYCQR